MNLEKRNEEPKEVVHVGWLDDVAEDESLQTLEQYVLLPYCKILQPLTRLKDQKKMYGDGAAIFSGSNTLIAKLGEQFRVIPLFHFTEFCLWSDLDDKDSPMIMERTFNENSEIALNCQNAEKRKVPYEDGQKKKDGTPYMKRYVEHINFVCHLPDTGNQVVFSFSRGEFYTGRQFATACSMRKHEGRRVPLWGQVWKFKSEEHSFGENEWFGFGFVGDGIISDDMVEPMKALHHEMKKNFVEKKLRVEHDEDTIGEETATAASAEL